MEMRLGRIVYLCDVANWLCPETVYRFCCISRPPLCNSQLVVSLQGSLYEQTTSV